MTNSSSVHCVQKALPGNTPVVGTMIALVSHQKPLAIYQNCQSARVLTSGRHGAPQVCGHSIRNQGNHGVPPVEHKKHLQEPLCAPELEAWVERQKPQTQDKFRKVSAVVLSDTNFWKNLDMCSRIFESVLQALCQRRHERWNPCYPVRSVPGSGQALQ